MFVSFDSPMRDGMLRRMIRFSPIAWIVTLTLVWSVAASAADLPDPFVFNDGRRVQTADDWVARRRELQEMILHDEYGPLPPAPKDFSAVLLVSYHPKAITGLHQQYKLTCDPGDGREK